MAKLTSTKPAPWKMKWSDSIPFREPLNDVRLLLRVPAQGWIDFLRDSEQAAYQRGQQDGERALTQQLLQQAGSALDLAQTRYDYGLGNIVELSTAQLNLTAAQIAVTSAHYDYQTQRILVDYQTGVLH